MATTAEQIRAWQGPALFSFGFRPFFLFGAVWVVLAMLIWLLALGGGVNLPTRFDPVSWHAHEFLFGYLGAVLAGFLLTAVPNWTGRLPIVGWKLAALFALWCAGRLGIFVSIALPVWGAAGIDLAFPVILGGLILQEIIAGKNWRNLIVLALLAVFTVANLIFHIEALGGNYAAQGYGLRLGLATAILMIGVIGGRIIPSFTRNWLVRQGNPARPAPPMQTFDKATLLISSVVLAIWVFLPLHRGTGAALIAFGFLHVVRLMRWQGHQTLSDPLVWVLHVAYAFIPLGAFALGADTFLVGAGQIAAQHIWMAGAIGAMTLAVMTRATLGHTGQALQANRATVAIYVCLFASVAARWVSVAMPQFTTISGLLWMAAFGGFALAYGPALLRAKPT